MRTALIALAMAALLAGCSKSPAPGNAATKSGDAVTQKLQQEAGGGATDCGRVKSQSADQVQPATDCAMKAAGNKQPFYVAYEMPGLTVGYAGNSQGKLFSIQSETAENAGAKADIRSVPCPGDLRVAQSGRVTCMLPGGMGMGGGANPHGGMLPATGTNPHGGGITMPPLGTPNPHGGMGQPSHPPAGKTPPKQ
jgi:hypothetical protein